MGTLRSSITIAGRFGEMPKGKTGAKKSQSLSEKLRGRRARLDAEIERQSGGGSKPKPKGKGKGKKG